MFIFAMPINAETPISANPYCYTCMHSILVSQMHRKRTSRSIINICGTQHSVDF